MRFILFSLLAFWTSAARPQALGPSPSWAHRELFKNKISLESFSKTLYPLLRARCINCHGDGGIAIGHSVSDVEAAFKVSNTLVDFSNLENSRFTTMVRRKHWLNYDPQATGMTEDEMVSALKNWWDQGASEDVDAFDFEAAPVLVPENLPDIASGAFMTLTWPSLGGALADCTLSIDVQRATVSTADHRGSYRVRHPRFLCALSMHPVAISGLYFPVSDQIAAFENAYKDVNTKLLPGHPQIVSSETLILISRKDQLETIGMKIRNLTIAAPAF